MLSKSQYKFVRLLEQKKYRVKEGLFVAEGPKVVGDLLKSGFVPQQIFATHPFLEDRGTEVALIPDKAVCVTQEELQKLSFLQHPQQVLGVFCIPHFDAAVPTSGLSLVLDGVQDPGNLGTIIRIADWFGISHVYCSHDTADAWSPKVVQATMGSISRVKTVYCDLNELVSSCSLPVYGTLLDGDDIYSQQLSTEGLIVFGNEGNGITPHIRGLVSRRLFIPSFGNATGAESLNVAVAAAIVCSEFRRRS